MTKYENKCSNKNVFKNLKIILCTSKIEDQALSYAGVGALWEAANIAQHHQCEETSSVGQGKGSVKTGPTGICYYFLKISSYKKLI